jgi:multiple sugar transport system substrate-binding protein
VLRWKRFVQGDEDAYLANVKKFSDKYGIEVRVDHEGWEDVRPKAAVAANTGAGPDIILSTNDDANLYPDKLVDMTDVANYLGGKYGGWYPACEAYLRPDGKKWIGVALGGTGSMMVYRDSHAEGRRRQRLPQGHRRLPQDVPGAEGQGHAGRHGAGPRHRRQRLDAVADLGLRRRRWSTRTTR